MIKRFIDAVATARSRRLPAETRTLPIFPLGAVLFPGGTLSLRIFETRYMDMAKASLKHQAPFGISLIREGQEVGTPAVPEPIGTVAVIEDWDMKELGVLQVRVSGRSRYRIRETSVGASGLVVAEVEDLADDASVPSPSLSVCATFLARVMAASGGDVKAETSRFDDAFWVGMRLTEMLPLPITIKQKMLELTDATMRLQVVERYLRDQQLIN